MTAGEMKTAAWEVAIQSVIWISLIIAESVFLPLLTNPLIYLNYAMTAVAGVLGTCVLFGLLCLDKNVACGWVLWLTDPVAWLLLLSPALVYRNLPRILTAKSCLVRPSNNTALCIEDLAKRGLYAWPVISDAWGAIKPLHIEQLSEAQINDHLNFSWQAIVMFISAPMIIRNLYYTGLVNGLVQFVVNVIAIIQMCDVIELTNTAHHLALSASFSEHIRAFTVFAVVSVILVTSTTVMMTSFSISGMKRIYETNTADQEMVEKADSALIPTVTMNVETNDNDKTSKSPVNTTYATIASIVYVMFIDVPFGCFRIAFLVISTEHAQCASLYVFLVKNFLWICATVVFGCVCLRLHPQVENKSFMTEFSKHWSDRLQRLCLRKRASSYTWSVASTIITIAMVTVSIGVLIIFICSYIP